MWRIGQQQHTQQPQHTEQQQQQQNVSHSAKPKPQAEFAVPKDSPSSSVLFFLVARVFFGARLFKASTQERSWFSKGDLLQPAMQSTKAVKAKTIRTAGKRPSPTTR